MAPPPPVNDARAREEPNWEHVFAAFPVNERLIWLNNCGTTPAGIHARQAVCDFLDAYSQKGVLAEGIDYAHVRDAILSILAGLLGVGTDELAIVHSTAEAFNLVSHGLALGPGDEILLLENEYPSNVYPWEHWRDKGVNLRFVPAGNTPGEFLEGLRRHLGPATRLAALSAVHWCTGMPLPLKEIGELCRRREVLLAVDGAQGVGHVQVDPKASNIDFMAFSGWKWLLGPLGIAALYVRRESLDRVRPVFKGPESVVDDARYLPYRGELKPGAARFSYSTANFGDWVYWRSSLEFLEGLGFEAVRARILSLADLLSDALRMSGFRILADKHGCSSAIVVAEKDGVDAARVAALLKARGIVAAERLGRLRFSPHVYNSPRQMQVAASTAAGL